MRRAFVFAFLLTATPALAQEEESREGRAATFQRAENPRATVPGGTFLVAAYAVIWGFLFLFVLVTWRRTLRLEAEVDRLTRALEQSRKDGGG